MPEETTPPALKMPLRVKKDPHAALVYIVESEHAVLAQHETWEDHAFTVDLEANPVTVDDRPVRNGGCGCPNFNFRRAKDVAEGKLSRCKHIKRAMEVYAEDKVVEESRERKAPYRHVRRDNPFFRSQ